MAVRIVPVDGVPKWEPNVPMDVLIWRDGRVVLALDPHFDDPDQRAVVFEWTGAHLATIGYPNDEGIQEHPLYRAGLDSVTWMGEVLRGDGEIGGRRFIIPTKENVVDITASNMHVHRIEGSTLDAAHEVVSATLA